MSRAGAPEALPSGVPARPAPGGAVPLARLVSAAGLVVLVAGLAFLGREALLNLARQPFTVDESQYAHAAWLVARGSVPYRDFFDPHFPLVYQLASIVFLLVGDDPAALVPLRLSMLPWLCGTLAAAWALNKGRRGAGALAILCLLACPGWLKFATQLRPDPLAAALFLMAAAALASPRAPRERKALVAGAALALAIWASQKALIYSVAFLPFVLASVQWPRATRREGRVLAYFAVGATLVFALVAVYLVSTRSLGAWWHWCFVWIRTHQRGYPGFPFTKELVPVLGQSAPVFLLAAAGIVNTIARLRRKPSSPGASADAVLLAAVPLTFASFAAQSAAFAYSLVPFIAVCCVFAGRGAALVWQVASRHWLMSGGALAVALVVLSDADRSLEENRRPSIAPQLEALRLLARVATPSDPVYDNTGSFIARPSVHFYFYTDAFLRESIADLLVREIPLSIIRSGCTVRVDDMRSRILPARLRTFLEQNFQRYSADLLVWGREYTAVAGCVEEPFLAPRAGSYLVDPPEILSAGVLSIGGMPVHSPLIRLPIGHHVVRYSGPVATFSVLWLPRDGVPWAPVRTGPPSLGQKVY